MSVSKLFINEWYETINQKPDQEVMKYFSLSVDKRTSYQNMVLKALSAEIDFSISDWKEKLDSIITTVIDDIENVFGQKELFWHNINIQIAQVLYAVTKRELIARWYQIHNDVVYKNQKEVGVFVDDPDEKTFSLHIDKSISRKIPLQTPVMNLGFSKRLSWWLRGNNILTFWDVLSRWKDRHVEKFKGMRWLGYGSYRELRYFLKNNRYIDDVLNVID